MDRRNFLKAGAASAALGSITLVLTNDVPASKINRVFDVGPDAFRMWLVSKHDGVATFNVINEISSRNVRFVGDQTFGSIRPGEILETEFVEWSLPPKVLDLWGILLTCERFKGPPWRCLLPFTMPAHTRGGTFGLHLWFNVRDNGDVVAWNRPTNKVITRVIT